MTILAGVTMCLTGCFSLETASAPSGGEHVVINNYGWKFFDWIPLVSGNASEDAACGTAFFRDDVTPEKLQARLVKVAAGRTVECPVFDVNDSPIWNVFGFPIPYVVTYHELTLSGTLK